MKIERLVPGWAVIALALGLAAPADASTINLSQTIDVSSMTSGGSLIFSSPLLQNVQSGDTFNIAITFKPGQSITASGLSYIEIALLTTWPLYTIDDNLSWSLLSNSDKPFLSGTKNGGLYESGFVGGVISSFDGLPADVSFHGFQVGGDVTGVELFPPTAAATLIGSGEFAIDANSFQITDLPGVPEPAAWAMLILGVGMIGIAARRRSARGLSESRAHSRRATA